MRRAAVDRQYRTGGVAGGRACEVERRAHDLFGLASALQRERLLRALGEILRPGPSLADVGAKRPGDDAVHSHLRPILLRLRDGELPDFLLQTAAVREGDWSVVPAPADLRDRRVEITGPTDRKMVINALNSGARVFMSDFEDSNSPTWENMIDGQRNLSDAIARTISLKTPEKSYTLNDEVATLLVRPRGWHLLERHFEVDGQPISASLFDFGLYLLRNHDALRAAGSGPYFYLPKLESHLEARLWNRVFERAQDELTRTLLAGVAATERELLGVFERNGLQRVEPQPGERFDHNVHQAMFEVENTGRPAGTVVEVLQPGYVLQDRLLRPAMVGVAKGGAAAPEPDGTDDGA